MNEYGGTKLDGAFIAHFNVSWDCKLYSVDTKVHFSIPHDLIF